MKNKLLASLIFLITVNLYAQGPDNNPGLRLAKKQALEFSKSRTTLCGPDTLLYSYLKEAFDAGLDTFYADPMVGPSRAWSQGFLSGGTISISGIQFWGNVEDQPNPAQTISAKVYLYTVNSAFMPMTKIDSAVAVVGTSQGLYTGMFAAPVIVTGDYAVVVQNPVSTDTLSIVINNGKTSTYGEGLAWRRYGSGVWNPAVVYAGQDLEPVIAPIVKYDVTSDFTSAPASPFCLGTTVNFTNTSSPSAALGNRMYNYSVFADHWGPAGIEDSTYAWDMGDGSGLVWAASPSYTYASGGTFNVALVTITGLFTNCVDVSGETIVVRDTAIAAFTADASGSPTISFTNTSSFAVTSSWDFGDGSPVDNTMNPSHTYSAPGTYTVTLTVSDANGCNTDSYSQAITIMTIGMAKNDIPAMQLFPNPSSGMLNIENNSLLTFTAEVYNRLGERVHHSVLNGPKAALNLMDLAEGLYSIRITSGDHTSVRQIAIIR